MSKWDSVKKVIATVAPGLATGLGGPLAGAAVTFITKALGLQPQDEDKAIAALSADPNAILALKVAEIEYQKFVADAGIKLESIEVDDRKDARSLAKVNIWPQIVLSVIYNVGYFALLAMFITSMADATMGEWQKGTIGTLVGILTAAIPQINAFWFGSSKSSQDKTALLGQPKD